MKMFDPSLMLRIEKAGVIAVVVLDRVDDALPVAEALLEGGISVMELTLRTDAALPAVRKISAALPDMLVGAGTVLTANQVLEAAGGGAAFGVAPGVNRSVLEAARRIGLSFAPGICTPSDIEAAHEQGCGLLKFFPAEATGGIRYLNAIAAPYAHLGLRYIPLGGLNDEDILTYAASPFVAALGGSWIATRELINAGKWQEITRRASKAQGAVQKARLK